MIYSTFTSRKLTQRNFEHEGKNMKIVTNPYVYSVHLERKLYNLFVICCGDATSVTNR